MKTRYLAVSGLLLAGSVLAAGTPQSGKIQQILLDTKYKEMNADVKADGQGQANTSSVQYKIGYKEGYGKAVSDLKQVLGEALGSVQAPQTGDHKSAQQWLSKSYQKLSKERNWMEGVEAATVAISINPKLTAAYINRSWGYAEKGLLDEAIRDANKAVDLEPTNPLAFNNRAYAYELAGASSKAQQDYKVACDLNHQTACDVVIRMSSRSASQLQQQLAQFLDSSLEKFKQKNWQAVELISTKALRLDPDNLTAYMNRAAARAELGRYSNAIADCNQALKINPNSGVAHNNCGYAYERQGDRENARVAYGQACKLGIEQSCQDVQRLSRQ